MKILRQILVLALFTSLQANSLSAQKFDTVSKITEGKPYSVMLTAYSTTLIANGRDRARLRIAITDSITREITSASGTVRIYLSGKGKILDDSGREAGMQTDTSGKVFAEFELKNGTAGAFFQSETLPGKTKVEARFGKIWPGAHEIHMLDKVFKNMSPTSEQIKWKTLPSERMIGADISWLPELESRGTKFRENGTEKDAVMILKDHGFNFIRLRIFVAPANDSGYSPGKGFCDLAHTLAMAKRIKAAGMKLLLDFHYSDYWADPQQQFKPRRWKNLTFAALQDSVREYTADVILSLKNQGTLPDMIQIGNEINHGILWPEGHIGNPDNLASLLKAGVGGVERAAPSIPIMMHIALGGQNKEAVFWLDNMIARGVRFDIIGLSYYPRWHGTLDDLQANLNDLAKRYNKPLNVVEYSDFKKTVHEIVFSLPDQMGKGACIWEPLNSWSGLFDKNNEVTPLMNIYDNLNKRFISETE